MAEIEKLPGLGCRHFAAGRCLYQEHLNPGYNQKWRCRVISRWEAAFDSFVERAECFNVSQEAVPDLWQMRFSRMAREVLQCEDYVFHQEGGVVDCTHVQDDICVLLLPLCQGRCRHYSLNKLED
ncbi:conserved protein of unknown function [Pseudodesulfovibrio profundus]|uniref:Uncharacterized protein n=1 Tax=Pseudodesulfovibrio profundus TaxID=57320 RepID=A0A2C8F4W9_9BACT|nr:hypothetical protein [Pseudodesulfovibrio profundus]SOB57766.1 conserved protein of unknown function [Pseudodesulfovibrio profundus]